MNLFAQNTHFETLFGLAEKSGVEKLKKGAYHGWKATIGGCRSFHMGNPGQYEETVTAVFFFAENLAVAGSPSGTAAGIFHSAATSRLTVRRLNMRFFSID